jgi:hypothetical protein
MKEKEMENPVLQIRILDPGFRIRCFFDPWIRDRKKSRSRIRDENLVSVFWVKNI